MSAATPARELGLSSARANLLIGPGGEAMTLYRLAPVAYPMLDDGEKWTVQRRLERLAHIVQDDLSLWRVCRAIDATNYPSAATARGPATAVDFDELIGHHRAALAEAEGRTVEVYLGVSLQSAARCGRCAAGADARA